MSDEICDLKRGLERHVGGESGEHQPTRVIKSDSKFSPLLSFKSYRVFEGFLRLVQLRQDSRQTMAKIRL